MRKAKEAAQEKQKEMETEIKRLRDVNSEKDAALAKLTTAMQETQKMQKAREAEWAEVFREAKPRTSTPPETPQQRTTPEAKMEKETEMHQRQREIDRAREKQIEVDYKRLVDSKTSNSTNSQTSVKAEKVLLQKEQECNKLQAENQKLILSSSDDQKRIKELILETEELVKTNK